MIRIELAPEIEAQLTAEAQACGIELDAYIAGIVASRSPAIRLSQEERRAAVQAMLDFSEKHHLTLGGLELKSMRHEGHKY